MKFFFFLLSVGLASAHFMSNCEESDVMSVLGCVTPFTEFLTLNPVNMTKSMAVRAITGCKNMKTCLNGNACAVSSKVDRTVNLLCEALAFFADSFEGCKKKMAKIIPGTRKIEECKKLNTKGIFDVKTHCESVDQLAGCVKAFVVDVCGQYDWVPLQEFFKKFADLNLVQCEFKNIA